MIPLFLSEQNCFHITTKVLMSLEVFFLKAVVLFTFRFNQLAVVGQITALRRI